MIVSIEGTRPNIADAWVDKELKRIILVARKKMINNLNVDIIIHESFVEYRNQ